jgi:hypothetical protein
MIHRQRRGFVQEEEFGVAARRHQLAMSASERKLTDDPALALVRAHNSPW